MTKKIISIVLVLSMLAGALAAMTLTSYANEISVENYDVKSIIIDGTDISEYAIILPAEVPEDAYIENAEYAAELIIKYVKEACGVTLSVAEAPVAHGITFVYDRTYGDEAFNITVNNGNVNIRCGILRGPMYAAFGFLKQFAGAKFYPREVIKFTPSEKNEIESGFSYTEGMNTPFKFRWSYNHSRIKKQYHASNSDYYPTTYFSSHNTGTWDGLDWIMTPKYGYGNCSDRNHSMFALIPDISTADVVCFTNKYNRNVCEENLRLVIDAFLAKGYKLGSTMPYISISENDIGGWCGCRTCRNFIADHGGVQTSTLVDFLNDMSDRLTPDYPGINFWTLAYTGAIKAPTAMELRDNIYICFAPICHCMVHPLEDNCFPDTIGDVTNIDGWRQLTDNIHYWWYGCNYYMTLFYQPQINWIYQNVKYLASMGIKGSFYENEEHTFGFIDLTSYIHSELVWNPDMTYEEYIEMTKQFCIDYYDSEAVFDLLMLCEDVKSDDCQRCVSYSSDGIKEFDRAKVVKNYDKFCELFDKARSECKDPEAYARLDRALLGIESVVISDCHRDFYVKGTEEQKAEFLTRYETFYNTIKALGNTCYFSYFDGVLDATFPETFNPEITPYHWYVPNYEYKDIPTSDYVTGWNQDENGWFYIYENGRKAQNEWVKDSKGWCFCADDTYIVYAQTVKDSKGWCLVGTDGYWVTKAGWNTVDGNWYYVQKDGYLKTRGWMQDSKGWCYLDGQGLMLTNTTIKDSKGYCLIDASGYWVTKAGWKQVSGDWYYIKKDGYLVTNGWMQDSKGWCYLDTRGKMMTSTSLKDSKGWCLVDASGYWVTKEGWKQVGSDWYYVQKSGYLVTNGWMKDSKGWCYLDAQGKMFTDLAIKDSHGWCLLDESGYWQTVDGTYTITKSFNDELPAGDYEIVDGYIVLDH